MRVKEKKGVVKIYKLKCKKKCSKEKNVYGIKLGGNSSQDL